MSHHLRLLQRGEWLLGNHFFHAHASFAVLTVNCQSKTGTARPGFDNETPLSEILRLADNRFSARYRMNRDNGRLEAEYSASERESENQVHRNREHRVHR
ncbi:MAG: hypothetical protein C5B58_08560 [Acidobacteria bacterium]|nr:MAG: hypothetical protein C5B58_08560 [Acidobacteriota bacterium]